MSLTIDITDQVIPALQRLDAGLAPSAAMYRYVADSASEVTQRAFQRMAGVEHNKFGVTGGFWNRMLSGTQAVAEPDAAIVRMPREIAQRYFGGEITPKAGKKFLAIPARAEAYNKVPLFFANLHFVPTGPDTGMLVQNEPGEGEGTAFYFLVRSVMQAPNKAVLPSDEEYTEAVQLGLDRYVKAEELC